MKSETVLCVGYARLPEGTTMEVLYKVFGVGLEIDPHSGIIVNAQTTCATALGDQFLSSILVNKNIETDIKEILNQIAKRYRANGGKAILAATKKAYAEYLNYKEEVKEGKSGQIRACRLDVQKILGPTTKLYSAPIRNQ